MIRIAHEGGLGNKAPESKQVGRVLVDENELVRWLTAQFQTYPECAAVSVEKVTRLDGPDSEGCNWSRTLVLNSAGTSPRD
jgi:hypothetical protein